jgi:hypothetical protein
MFYIDSQGNIANALFNCNMTTGLFVSQGNWIISNGAPSIHSNSGLAAVVLGSTAGYRVYFHDNDGAINELAYTASTDWQYNGIISHDINSLPALAAAFGSTNNITVASARDEQNMAATRYNKDETWFRCTDPPYLSFLPSLRPANLDEQQLCHTHSRAISPPLTPRGRISP